MGQPAVNIRELALQWYAWLSSLNALVADPLSDLERSINVPLVSALLFGLLGATAPCQLTTNASAMAFVARGAASRSAVAGSATGYVVGKMLVYTLLGLAVALAGQRLAQQSIPVIVVARKVLGPAMIVLGLYLLGFLPLRLSLRHGLAERVERRVGGGALGAFLLGTGLSFAFCPTLFLLFFGLTIPLALASPAGPILPAVFALGTSLPLLVVAVLLTLRGGAKSYIRQTRRAHRWIRPIAAGVLVLAGLNDTLTYWLL
ncbi:MAG TPA: sulfite exporter TauE/SafE family protein [Chloroflexota bacterium]